MILSFELPFALIPLLKFSSSRNKMGQCNNSIYVSKHTHYRSINFINCLYFWLWKCGICWLNPSMCLCTQIVGFSWTLGFIIIGINVYFLSSKLIGWILHNSLPIYANVLVGVTLFPLMLLYIAAVVYLTFRKDTVKFMSRRELQDIDDTEKAKVANEGGSEDDRVVQ